MTGSTFVFIAFVAVVALILVARSVKVVPDGMVYVVERLGRYSRTLSAGLHVVPPFFDRVAFRFSLRPAERLLSESCITHDNVAATVTATIRWEIVDARKAAYGAADAAEFVDQLVRTSVRQWIGARDWTGVRESTRELGAAVERSANEPAAGAGLRITAVEIERVERAA